eukprot:1730815-Rhodomonas_salina.1
MVMTHSVWLSLRSAAPGSPIPHLKPHLSTAHHRTTRSTLVGSRLSVPDTVSSSAPTGFGISVPDTA